MSGLTWNKNTLMDGFDEERIAAAVHMRAQTEAARIQGHMQARRPWTDQTGQAKRTLATEASRDGTRVLITLSHGVEYGRWLEIRWNRRYAIVHPTLATQGPRVMQNMRNLLQQL